MVGTLADDWRDSPTICKLSKRLEMRLALNYDVLIMTASPLIAENCRADKKDIQALFSLDSIEAILETTDMPRGISFDFKSLYTYVIYIHETAIDTKDFIPILVHEASHIVDYIELNAAANFCTETRAYMIEEVISIALEILNL